MTRRESQSPRRGAPRLQGATVTVTVPAAPDGLNRMRTCSCSLVVAARDRLADCPGPALVAVATTVFEKTLTKSTVTPNEADDAETLSVPIRELRFTVCCAHVADN